jgi:hypothetical protein
LGAVGLANVLYWMTSDELRLVIAGSAAVFVLFYIFMASRNPDYFYRRLISWVTLAGLAANTFGFSFEFFLRSDPLTGWVKWDGAASLSFNIAWVGTLAILAALEGWRMHKAG